MPPQLRDSAPGSWPFPRGVLRSQRVLPAAGAGAAGMGQDSGAWVLSQLGLQGLCGSTPLRSSSAARLAQTFPCSGGSSVTTFVEASPVVAEVVTDPLLHVFSPSGLTCQAWVGVDPLCTQPRGRVGVPAKSLKILLIPGSHSPCPGDKTWPYLGQGLINQKSPPHCPDYQISPNECWRLLTNRAHEEVAAQRSCWPWVLRLPSLQD